MKRGIYWVRNDLRTNDNPALTAFAEGCAEGLAVWCPTSSFLRAGARRRSFVLQSLFEFRSNLETLGGTLWMSSDSATVAIPKLIKDTGATDLYATKECCHEEVQEEEALKSYNLHLLDSASLISPAQLPFSAAETPKVFTRFREIVEARGFTPRQPLPKPTQLPGWSGFRPTNAIPTFDPSVDHPHLPPGEHAALSRLQDYIWTKDRLKSYKETRNGMLDWEDSSKWSPYLAVGALSAAQIYAEVKKYERDFGQNESTYWMIFELLWRDYFRLIAEQKGPKLFNQNSPHQDDQSIDDQKKQFELWKAGRTGDDFVDANMHELLQTGWMSNRGRQNVASYLAKTLGVDWRWGASFFEQELIDYDPASNWGNWAYLAGVGQDPRNRTFNTRKQAEMYDPLGEYRRRWLSKE